MIIPAGAPDVVYRVEAAVKTGQPISWAEEYAADQWMWSQGLAEQWYEYLRELREGRFTEYEVDAGSLDLPGYEGGEWIAPEDARSRAHTAGVISNYLDTVTEGVKGVAGGVSSAVSWTAGNVWTLMKPILPLAGLTAVGLVGWAVLRRE